MKINFKKSTSKYGKLLLFSCILILSVATQVSLAQRKWRQIDCRKYVFAPPCRGVAAKRDMQSSTDNFRYFGQKAPWDLGERLLSRINKAYL